MTEARATRDLVRKIQERASKSTARLDMEEYTPVLYEAEGFTKETWAQAVKVAKEYDQQVLAKYIGPKNSEADSFSAALKEDIAFEPVSKELRGLYGDFTPELERIMDKTWAAYKAAGRDKDAALAELETAGFNADDGSIVVADEVLTAVEKLSREPPTGYDKPRIVQDEANNFIELAVSPGVDFTLRGFRWDTVPYVALHKVRTAFEEAGWDLTDEVDRSFFNMVWSTMSKSKFDKRATLATLASERGLPEAGLKKAEEAIDILKSKPKPVVQPAMVPEESPFKDNWLDKALQEQITKTVARGDKQFAVVLEDAPDVNPLVRAAGAQQMYSTKVRAKLASLAGKLGGKYKEVIIKPSDKTLIARGIIPGQRLPYQLSHLPIPISTQTALQSLVDTSGDRVVQTALEAYRGTNGNHAEAINWLEAEGITLENPGVVREVFRELNQVDSMLPPAGGTKLELDFQGSDQDITRAAMSQMAFEGADKIDSLIAGLIYDKDATVKQAESAVGKAIKFFYVNGGDVAVTVARSPSAIPKERLADALKYLWKHHYPRADKGATLGVIELPAKPNLSSFRLYSAGIGIPAITQLLSEDYKPEEISDLAAELGADTEEVDSMVRRILQGRVDALKAQGYTDTQLGQLMQQAGLSNVQLDRFVPKNTRPADAPDTWTGKLTDYEVLRLAKFYRNSPENLDPAKAEAKFGDLYKEMQLRGQTIQMVKEMEDVSPREMQQLAMTIADREPNKPSVGPDDPVVVTPYETVQREDITPLSPEELAESTRNVRMTYGNLLDQGNAILFGNKEARARVETALREETFSIVDTLNRNNIPASLNATGDIVFQDPETGETKELDVGLWDSIVLSLEKSRAEIGSAVVGGIAGGTIGGMVFGPWGAVVGGVVAGAGSAALGRGSDVIRNTLETKADIDKELLFSRMVDAGAADAVFSIVGGAVLYTGAKVFGRAFDLMVQGNRKGAYAELKSTFLLDDAQVDELLEKWETITKSKAPGLTRETQALTVLPRLLPGAEALTGAAGRMSPTASTVASREISLRASDIRQAADNLTSSSAPEAIQAALPAYQKKVVDQFDAIKRMAEIESANSPYRFDYDSIGLEPILTKLEEKISDPRMLEAFERYVRQLRKLGAYTTSQVQQTSTTVQQQVTRPYARGGPKTTTQTVQVPTTQTIEAEANDLRTFANLLELRRAVNSFKYSKQLLGTTGGEAVQEVLRRIDDQIATGANVVMPGTSAKWLQSWREVNVEYSKMKSLERNVLARALQKNAVSAKSIAQAMLKNSQALDSTFRNVIEVLPERQRKLVEGEVVKGLVEKYSAGVEGGKRAIQFPLLAKELATLDLTSTDARQFRRVVNEFADVFRSDVAIAQATGEISLPRFQSYLTTDPVVRLKYEVASGFFNYVKRLAPGAKGRNIALVTNVAKLLENPLSAAEFKSVANRLPTEVIQPLEQLRLEMAKWGTRSAYPDVTVYRSAPAGQSVAKTDGPLGRGVYYYTSENSAKANGAGRLNTRQIRPSLIANEENLKQLLGVETLDLTQIKGNSRLRQKLWEKGYDGINIGEEVMLF